MKHSFKSGGARPYTGTQAVLRAVSLLKAFTDAQPERGLTELARAVDLNKTTTYRLLTALESEGMVARSADADTYRLGPEAIALGSRALRSVDLRSACRAELESLAQQTGETATLEVLAEGQVLIVDEVTSHHLLGSTQFVGTHWPAHATSTGKVLLAELSESERKAMLPSPLVRPTKKTIASQAALAEELARVREQGYAAAVEELEAGYVAVGAAVRNHERRAVAAISIGGPSVRLTPDRVSELAVVVRQAADRISKKLGYMPRE